MSILIYLPKRLELSFLVVFPEARLITHAYHDGRASDHLALHLGLLVPHPAHHDEVPADGVGGGGGGRGQGRHTF